MSLLPPGPPAPPLIRKFGDVVDWVTILIGAAIVTLIVVNVVLHLFQKDAAFTTEVSQVLMVWVTFIGAAAAARRCEHVAITEFVDFLSVRKRRLADALIQLICACVLILLIWYGMSIVQASWGNQLSVTGWPMAIEYLALPVGSAAMLVFVLFDLVQIVRGVPRAERYPR